VAHLADLGDLHLRLADGEERADPDAGEVEPRDDDVLAEGARFQLQAEGALVVDVRLQKQAHLAVAGTGVGVALDPVVLPQANRLHGTLHHPLLLRGADKTNGAVHGRLLRTGRVNLRERVLGFSTQRRKDAKTQRGANRDGLSPSQCGNSERP